MTAVYKRELRSFFTTLTGYIFIAAVVAFTGIYFMVNNLHYGIPYFSYTVVNSLLIYIFVVPILTMRSFAEERRSKTDQLLLTSPTGVTGIVLGKYLAMVTVYIIPLIIFCLCPLIIRTGGTYYLLGDYNGILCMLFVGMLFTAVGMFISGLTDNQIISAVLTIIVLFIMYMWRNLVSFLPNEPAGNLVCLLIAWSAVTAAVWFGSKNKIFTAVTGAVGFIAAVALFSVNSDMFSGLAGKLLGSFSVGAILYNACYYYVFDVGGLFMLLSLAAVLVFLTIQTIQKRRGAVTVLTSAAVIIIAVLLNLLIAQLPSSYREIDVTGDRLYTMSDTSRDYVKNLNDDIELILVGESDNIDERISKSVYNYAAMTNKITVREVDPVLYPSALNTYECPADSLVVLNKTSGKQTYIPFDGTSDALIIYTLNYDTYRYEETWLDTEGQITSAIDYVTADKSAAVYALSGHGESELSGSVSGLIGKANISVTADLNLLKNGGIPDDAQAIVINNPTVDLAADELEMLREYLASGGNVVLLLDSGALNNFTALTADYGMTVEEGYVGDEASYYAQYAQYYGYFCMSPTFSEDGILSRITNGAMVIYPRSIKLTDPARETIEQSAFMTTTDSGVLVTDGNTDGTAGKYTLGVTASEDTDSGKSTLTLISAVSLIDENITGSFANMSNLQIFMAALTQNINIVSSVTIPARSLSVTYNVFDSYGVYASLFVFILPAVCLATGLIVWLKRRKR